MRLSEIGFRKILSEGFEWVWLHCSGISIVQKTIEPEMFRIKNVLQVYDGERIYTVPQEHSHFFS